MRNHDICYLFVYVDDILLTGDNFALIHCLITLLSLEFKLRDLGNAHYFLGVEVTPTSVGLMLSQHKYALDILCHAGMSSCKPVDTPAFVSKLDLLSIVLLSDPTHFRQIVGALQYLTFTKPDICYAVNKVCQFMHAPTESHWAAVKGILCYLKGTSSYGIHLTCGSSLSLHRFIDADWVGSVDDKKSTGGYIIFLGTIPVSWKSGKQRTGAHSSTEAEYKALVDGTAEVLWLCYLLTYMCFSPSSVTTIWCDNLSATYLSANPIFHARTKHVKVDYHFARDGMAKKEIQIRFISSKDQLAYVFTKPFSYSTFALLRSTLHVYNPPSA
jgi:histone deacetylase 1/2